MKFLERFTLRTIAWSVLVALALLCAGVWVAVVAATPRGVLTVVFLDVGQGDAIFIESPTGVQVLIDGGPNAAVLRELSTVMPYSDRTLDAVIATHPDADHIGGLIDVLKRYRVSNIIDPQVPKSTATARAFVNAISKNNIPFHLARRGMVLDLGKGARLKILFPDRNVSNLPERKSNEGAVVAQLTYGESEVLFMADVPASVEHHLISIEPQLESDILKVGHHGSKTSTSDALLNAAAPGLAVISVGGNNRYGHPTSLVLSRLESYGIDILRTDEKGTVRCVSNGYRFTCN